MKAFECLEHITTAGERWDTLAWRYYGDASLLSPIIEANPALDISITLASGQLILIPLLDRAEIETVTSSADLPPWKR